MTTINAQVPDFIVQQALAFAQQEKISMDQLVALALSTHLTAWASTSYLEARAKRADMKRFREIMAKVPSVEPADEDKFEDSAKR